MNKTKTQHMGLSTSDAVKSTQSVLTIVFWLSRLLVAVHGLTARIIAEIRVSWNARGSAPL